MKTWWASDLKPAVCWQHKNTETNTQRCGLLLDQLVTRQQCHLHKSHWCDNSNTHNPLTVWLWQCPRCCSHPRGFYGWHSHCSRDCNDSGVWFPTSKQGGQKTVKFLPMFEVTSQDFCTKIVNFQLIKKKQVQGTELTSRYWQFYSKKLKSLESLGVKQCY